MSTSIKQVMGTREWIMLLVLSVLWGGSFFFAGVAVGALPPLTIVALRVGLAALSLWCVIAAMGLRVPVSGASWRAFFGMGVLNNVIPFTLIVWGQTFIASGLASILNGTTPLFTVIVAGVMLADERIVAAKIIAVVIGFAGVVIMIGPSVSSGLGADVVAQIAILVAALSYAFAGVFGRRFKTMGIDPIVTAAGQVTASAILLLPLAVFVDYPLSITSINTSVWLAITGLAVLSTALAYILYFKILASAGATNLLLVTFLVPVSAIILGVLILGEQLEPVHFIGMALIGIALLIIDGRLWRRIKSHGILSAQEKK